MPNATAPDTEARRDAIEWFFRHRDQIVSVWGIFGSVAVGVLGFSAFIEGPLTHKAAAALAFGFSLFAVGNLSALLAMYKELKNSYNIAKAQFGADPMPVSEPIGPWRVGAYHVLLWLSALIALAVKAEWP